MTIDLRPPSIELVDPASLEALTAQAGSDVAIGWHAHLPVSERTWIDWHRNEAPPQVPEIWCAHLQASENAACATLWIDPALPVFAGHFPDNPILPGIVQIEWIRTSVARIFQSFNSLHFAGLANIKFKAMIPPGSWLKADLRAEPMAVQFVIESAGRVCTQGRLLYRSPPHQGRSD
jgi:3-hydroxymyristoyl/3-hydroxydecanoyl-(acyl carrier protein) dehydratase